MSERKRYRRDVRLDGKGGLREEWDEEVESHLRMREDALVAKGWTREAARAEALRRFGDREAVRAGLRRRALRVTLRALLESTLADVRLSLRQWRRSPGYAALALLTFATGIGLTTTMYTLIDRVLLRPLSYPASDRLVVLMSVDSAGREYAQVSMGNYVDWRASNRTLESVALWRYASATTAVGGDAQRVPVAQVAGEFFDVMRPRMAAGRAFTVEEAQTGGAAVVVSEAFWRARLGSAPLPAPLSLDGRAIDVVGVVAAGSEYPEGVAVWVGWPVRPEPGGLRNNVNWQSVARLRAGVDATTARADLGEVAARIRTSDPAGVYSWGVGVVPLQNVVVASARDSLLLLAGGVTFVLLVGCANLAGLGLARAAVRRPELALRQALGAGRQRVARQLITEVFVLALVGGGLGVVLAWWSIRLVVLGVGAQLPRVAEIGLDARILGVAFAFTLLAGLIAALPAFMTGRMPLRALLGSERTMVRGGRNLPGSALVAAEIALAMLLLAGSGLLIRSFRSVLDRSLGFDPEGVLTAELTLTGPAYASTEARDAFWQTLVERARALPGVRGASLANWTPTQPAGRTFVEFEERPDVRSASGYRMVDEDYFATMRIALLEGRSFERSDVAGGERVAVVNRQFVRQHYADGVALGRRIRAPSQESVLPGGAGWLRIAGVVDDIRHYGHEQEVEPEIYVSARQRPAGLTMTLVLRAGSAQLAGIETAVGGLVRSLDAGLAPEMARLEQRVDTLLRSRRLTMAVLTGFGALALGLAAIGVYGLVSFAVAQRTREMGVRAALGADRRGLLTLVLGSALRIVAVGLVVGTVASLALARLMAGLLFGVRPADPLSHALAALALLAVSVAATLIPAWRAARTDPLTALRQT